MSPNRPKHLKILPLALLCGLAGCAAQRPVLDDAFLSGLGPRTTSEEVLQNLGHPTFEHAASDGGRALGYVRRCPAAPTAEPCSSAPQGAPWQVCEIRFTRADRYDGIACTWTANP